MSLFNKEDITLKTIPKTLVDGNYITGTITTRTIEGNIQPDTPDEQLINEYGNRIKKMCLVVSDDEILISEYIFFRSEDYKIIKLDDFSNQDVCVEGQYQATGAILVD